MRFFARFVTILLFAGFGLQLTSPMSAQTPLPPIEAYGELPTVSSMAISPDGSRLAFIQRNGENNTLRVLDLADGMKAIYGGDIGKAKTINIEWAGNKHVIFRIFDTFRIYNNSRKTKYSAAFSINVDKGTNVALLSNNRRFSQRGKKDAVEIFPNQSGLGQIIAHRKGTNDVFMPAYVGSEFSDPTYDVVRVDLDTGRPKPHARGELKGAGWIVDTDGTVLAREVYDNKSNLYSLYTRRNGTEETIMEVESNRGPAGLVGVTPDRSSLIMFLRNNKGFNELRRMDFNGKYSAPEMSRENTEIEYVLRDTNQVVFGVAYAGLQPSYDFFDEQLAADVKAMQDKAPEASVRLESWSDNFTRLIFYIEGTGFAGNYILLDRATSETLTLTSSRPNIPTDAIGDVLTIEYKAKDGLKIPGVMTVPHGKEISNLPAIIMPHGGPESHDKVAFDFIAQYFASRGYLVLQPNFRGSDGFGTKFTEAGYGGWGGVMQQDITDGVAALVKGGMIDPERVCIVGWSYGGYAALAGGAFTPDLYKCVAAIAPVSDLPRMMFDEKNDHGKDHWVLGYWADAIARGDATRDTLRAKSPAMFADNFKAPVLLIHGKDDLVVKLTQSNRMKKALEKAGKDVDMITVKGGDHSLLSPGSRLRVLQALDEFVEANIGPHSAG